MRIPRVLSIAGTDPTGGAGIQTDLKSIAANGGYGMAVITALVAQNTMGVRSVHVPPVSFLAEQLDAVSDDVEIDAVKIGMLATSEVIRTVDIWLQRVKPPVVVLDPVMVATSGDRLLDAEAEHALRALLARADLITPNVPELAMLAERAPATTWEGVLEQAEYVSRTCGVMVLAKGGHLQTGDQVADALVTAAEGSRGVVTMTSSRIQTVNTHGTGCSLSSALATLQPITNDWEASLTQAKAWMTTSLRRADELQVGHGHGPINHFATLWSTTYHPERSVQEATDQRVGYEAPGNIPLARRPEQREGSPCEARISIGAADPISIADTWWQDIASIRTAIDELPFINALADGSLDAATFRWYLNQDALYLRDFARALSQASALSPNPGEQAFWAESAHLVMAEEMAMQRQWLPAGITDPPSTVTTQYVNHLLASAVRGYPVLVAALLPCYWLYQDIGERLAPYATEGHPYQAWLETYGDPEFSETTQRAIDLVTGQAVKADAETRAAMWEAFRVSSVLEHAFFLVPTQRS